MFPHIFQLYLFAEKPFYAASLTLVKTFEPEKKKKKPHSKNLYCDYKLNVWPLDSLQKALYGLPSDLPICCCCFFLAPRSLTWAWRSASLHSTSETLDTHTHKNGSRCPFWCRWNHLGVFLNHFCFILIRPMHTFTVVFTQLNVAVICVALHLEILEGIYCTSLKKKMDLLFGDSFKFRLLTVFFFNFSNLYLSTVIFFFF